MTRSACVLKVAYQCPKAFTQSLCVATDEAIGFAALPWRDGWILTRSATPPSPCFIGKFIGKKAFPFQIPSFHRTLRASSRLGRKEYRAGSMRSGVALRVRIQAGSDPFGKMVLLDNPLAAAKLGNTV